MNEKKNKCIIEPQLAVSADFIVAGQKFSGVMASVENRDAENNSIALSAAWQSNGNELSLRNLAEAFIGDGVLPDINLLEYFLIKAGIVYCNGAFSVNAILNNKDFKSEISFTGKSDKGESSFYELSLSFPSSDGAEGKKVKLHDLPVLGPVLSDNDYIMLIKMIISRRGQEFLVSAKGELSFFGQKFTFPNSEEPPPLNSESTQTASALLRDKAEDKAENNAASNDGITWIEVNKTIKALRIGRVGIAFKDQKIKVFLDAGLSISVFNMDFMELKLGIDPTGKSFEFGLRGLAVSMNSASVSVSGGLYNAGSPGEILYNGMLKVRIKDISINALGSYAEIMDGKTEKRTSSFFLYAALLTPLGGPAFFYITGVALGFGLNRTVIMPQLHDVPKFPLVKTVMGTGGPKANESPADALNALSSHIKPSAGSYFIAAGVKFTSFGIAKSFALLLVEAGHITKAVLLGTSVISMPPNQTKNSSPMMYAELALRAVFDFDAGYLEVIAALTGASYVLSPKCRLQGGFAFALWTKGDRAGDFIITLGGCHHPLFASRKAQYPAVEKLGVNWDITSSLSLKGQSYLAVTQSCVMAGFDLAINYQSGNLKAWLNAGANFYMHWKPFYYEAEVKINVGVSYTLKVLFIRKTFKLEIGADLQLWGPDFSGILRINLKIISFTIKFGNTPRQQPAALDWNAFRQSFLPLNLPAEYGQVTTENAICQIQLAGGVLFEGKSKGGETVFVSPQELVIITRSPAPSSRMVFNGENIAAKKLPVPGIAPMGIKNITSVQTVTIRRDGCAQKFDAAVLCENVSAALWGDSPGPGAELITEYISGIKITVPAPELSGFKKRYSIQDLAVVIETTGKEGWDVSGGADPETRTPAPGERPAAALLADVFPSLCSPVYSCGGIYEKPGDYLWAIPMERKTGVKVKKG